MRNSLKMVNNIILVFCVIFSVTTLASCIINLAMGNTTDTYGHILDRAVLSLIGSIVINITIGINFKNPILNFFIPYLIFIILAFIYVFISGFFEELHPNAYRDIFLNDTVAYIVIYIGVSIYQKISKHK